MNALLSADHSLTVLLYHILPHTPLLDWIFRFFSLQGNAVVLWIVPLAYLVVIERRRDKQFLTYFTISMTCAYLAADMFLKNMLYRMRPPALDISTYACPTTYSFPSTHAALAFAAAVMLSTYDKKRRVFYYGVAVLISFSRIYLQCHYLLDIVGGALLGSAISLFFLYVGKRGSASSKSKKNKRG